MAGGRDLEETATWAVAVVCCVLVSISIMVEYIIHLIAKWLKKRNKKALHEALENIKSELMLLGFISLLLTATQSAITKICISEQVANSWHPCTGNQLSETTDVCGEGKVAFVSTNGIHQLHTFIFVLAVFHVLYCILTLLLGTAKMRKWKRWEEEPKTFEYQFSHDPERFRFAKETSFGRRHLRFWTKTPLLIWIVCFFRQFVSSVPKVDYLTLRHGFMMAHLSPQCHENFDFQKYIERTLEEDFKVVVGISPPLWAFAVFFILLNTHGWYSYLWFPFIPLIIILLVGTKLQVIITKMGLRIEERGDVVKGVPLVQPGDEYFWLNRPRLMLYLINFTLFQNAFELAFFIWSLWQYGLNRSCFHSRTEDVAIRTSMGVVIQILCSYVTLPLYALVTQMGSRMKETIFEERVAGAIRKWHQSARRRVRRRHAGGGSGTRSSNPTHSMSLSPVHLLGYYRSELDSARTSPRDSNVVVDDADHFTNYSSPSPNNNHPHSNTNNATPTSSSPLPYQITQIPEFSFGKTTPNPN